MAQVAATASNSFFADARPDGVVQRPGDVGGAPPVRGPLPHVADHLAQAEAQERGEVDDSIDAGLLLETISAPLVERLCVTGAPLTPHFVEFNIQLVLRGTRPRG